MGGDRVLRRLHLVWLSMVVGLLSGEVTERRLVAQTFSWTVNQITLDLQANTTQAFIEFHITSGTTFDDGYFAMRFSDNYDGSGWRSGWNTAAQPALLSPAFYLPTGSGIGSYGADTYTRTGTGQASNAVAIQVGVWTGGNDPTASVQWKSQWYPLDAPVGTILNKPFTGIPVSTQWDVQTTWAAGQLGTPPENVRMIVTGPGAYNATVDISDMSWWVNGVGGDTTFTIQAPSAPAVEGTYTVRIGYTTDGQTAFYETDQTTAEVEGSGPAVTFPTTYNCGASYAPSWTGLDQANGPHQVRVEATSGTAQYSQIYTLVGGDYPDGSGAITLPDESKTWDVTVYVETDTEGEPWPGAGIQSHTFQIACTGSGGGGGEGEWDQAEIDQLLASAAGTENLAAAAATDRASMIGELQDIEAAIGDIPAGMTAAEFSATMEANTVGAPGSFTPETDGSVIEGEVGTAVSSPSLDFTGATYGTAISVDFPLPAGQSHTLTVELDPRAWPADPVYSAVDAFRGIFRSLLAALIVVMFGSRVLRTLRQY